MYSILLDEVEKVGGKEERLVEQLSEEFGFSLREALDNEEEPTEDELEEAVGGPGNMNLLGAFFNSVLLDCASTYSKPLMVSQSIGRWKKRKSHDV
jgi:hypothetical protein